MNNDLARLMKYVKVIENGCWIWTGGTRTNSSGTVYGFFSWKGRPVASHRVSYELFKGPIPKGRHIHHNRECSKLCVNPEHLHCVTPKDHVRLDDTPAGRNAAKTHCKSGHPFDEDNTLYSNGRRTCRACARAAVRRSYWKSDKHVHGRIGRPPQPKT